MALCKLLALEDEIDLVINVEEIQGAISSEILKQQKSRKKLLLAGASQFNQKPKDGIQYFLDNGFVSKTEDSGPNIVELAVFLRKCPRIDKRLLGDYISKPNNLDLLDAFIGQFDFKKVRF